MADKSNLPDFKEISSIASKLFKDLKTSIDEIVQEYKEKRKAESQRSAKNSAEDKNSEPAETKKNNTTKTKAKKTDDKKDD